MSRDRKNDEYNIADPVKIRVLFLVFGTWHIQQPGLKTNAWAVRKDSLATHHHIGVPLVACVARIRSRLSYSASSKVAIARTSRKFSRSVTGSNDFTLSELKLVKDEPSVGLHNADEEMMEVIVQQAQGLAFCFPNRRY